MKDIDKLLSKKLNGRLTEKEELDFQLWLSEAEENLTFFQKMELLKKEGKAYHLYEKIDVNEAWKQVSEKRQFQDTAATPKRQVFVKYRMALAAAIALLIGSSFLFYYLQIYSAEIQLRTSYGEKSTFVLPDQTEVILNANSSLTYRKNQSRKVCLDGEAFFKVAKKEKTGEKFQVSTRDLEVEVLGTAFNVNTHQYQTKVYLEEGSVKLALQDDNSPEGSDIYLEPGEILTYSSKKKLAYVKAKAPSSLESSWKEGTQLFEKKPLAEVLRKMEDIYGVKIEVKDKSLLSLDLTVGIPVEELNIALETLENVLELRIIHKDEKSFVLE